MYEITIVFVLLNKVGTAQRKLRIYLDIAMASSGSPPRSAFAAFATGGASDLEQEEQAAAAAHAAIPTPAGSAGPREPRQDFDIHTPGGPGDRQEVLRQLAGFTALLQQMRQEAEAVQRKVTDLEKLVVPGADPLPDS